jgi:hypothetical protein
LARSCVPWRGAEKPGADTAALARERIIELKALCETYGARLVLWLPPTPAPDRGAVQIISAGEQSDVPVLVPVSHKSIPDDKFPDGFHLNSEGAQFVTVALAAQLRSIITGSGGNAHVGESHPFRN